MNILLGIFQTVLIVSVVTGIVWCIGQITGNKVGYRWRKILWLILAVRLLFPVPVRIEQLFPEASFYQIEIGITERSTLQSLVSQTKADSQPIEELESPVQSDNIEDEEQSYNVKNEEQAGNDADKERTGSIESKEQSESETELTENKNQSGLMQLPIRWSIFIIWTVGALAALYFRYLQYQYIKNTYLQDAVPCTRQEAGRLTDEIRREFKIRKKIPVMEQKNLRSPMLFGYFRTTLFLPAIDYEHKELEAILRHELTHYKKRDLWYKLFIAFISDVYWFNPVSRLMKKMAFADVEFVCDEDATKGMDAEAKKVYGNAILRTMEGANSRALSLSTQFAGGKKSVKKRLENLFTKKNKWGYGIALVLVLAVIVGTVFVSVTNSDDMSRLSGEAGSERTDKEEADTSEKVYVVSEGEKLQNFLVENYDDLHIGEDFKIENYYITNLSKAGIYFYIDDEGVLWGCGDNNCGQLGIGKQTTYQDTSDGSTSIDEPQKIAENVVHVDTNNFPGQFAIFLTGDGKLYGMGANMNGLMGMEVPEDINYFWNPTTTVAVSPVLLMEDVRYARCGMGSIVALKEDGSVWYWGEIRTTTSVMGNQTVGCVFPSPHVMMVDAVYVTSGYFTMAAIKEDGSLWTWGNNSFGSCGVDSGALDFVEKPVKAAENVKMVWFDQMVFNSYETRLVYDSRGQCSYTYTTFIEKEDGTLWACGADVTGEGRQARTYQLYGDMMEPAEAYFTNVFNPVTVSEMNHQPNRLLAECEFGWTKEKLLTYLDSIGMDYYEMETADEDGSNRQHYIWGLDSCYLFMMNEYEQLAEIESFFGGSRDGRLQIGMSREEAEEILGESYDGKTNAENSSYEEYYYRTDTAYYTLCFYKGKLERIDESLYSPQEYMTTKIR